MRSQVIWFPAISTTGFVYGLRTGEGSMSKSGFVYGCIVRAMLLAIVLGISRPAHAANFCGGSFSITYPDIPNPPTAGSFLSVGDTVHVVLQLGSGAISGTI